MTARVKVIRTLFLGSPCGTIQHGTSVTATGPLLSFLSSTGTHGKNAIPNTPGFPFTL